MKSATPDLKAVFGQAAEIASPAERAAYLDEACRDNVELRAQIDGLLAAAETAGSFMRGPAVAHSDIERITPATERPGAAIGPYKLLQQIGEGGMGVVWMAEQTQPVQRKVALKVIKPGMDSRQVIARFEAERQALAMMDHVNIARVLDAGTTGSGLPYFVMELVHGVPITQYCDNNHLTPRERLELFVPVCQAIQHAHQKGIIHRDIKPSNVMITLYDGKPVPKVIDFGVAKAIEQQLTERTLFTQYGTMVGTLEYMSPEQAEMSGLGADTRSDIFSLGVLLYELLTGSTPLTRKRLKEAAYAEVLRLIKEEEPPKPSTRLSESGEAMASISAQRHMDPAKLTKLVRGELDWIVMKTLEKDRNRRYETANGLAAEVQRYLGDETVLACPPSGWYRFRKFARRNKAALVMASVVSVGVLFLLVGLAVGIVLVNREKELVKDERDQKDQALQLADANLTQAHESVNRYFTIVSEDTLLDAPGLQPLRKQLLEAALKYYQGFLQQRSHDPKLQADVAVTYLRISVIYNSLGEYDEAVLALVAGLETVDSLVREHPGDTELPKRFAGYFSNRRPFHSKGRAMKTDPRRVLQALRRSAELWEGFARDNPNSPGFRSDLIETYVLLGGGLAEIDQDESLRAYRKASETAEKLVRENPAVPRHRERLAKVYYDLAGALKRFGRTQEVETTYRKAVECFEKPAAEFPDEPEFCANLGISLKHLANFFAVHQRDKEAEAAFRRSVVLLDKVANDFPDNLDCRDALSVSYEGLANCLLKDSGRLQEAEKVLRQALSLQEKLAREYPHVPKYRRTLAASYGTLSGVLNKDRPEEAVKALRQKLAVREKLVIDYPTIERYSVELLETQKQLSKLLDSTGQTQEVEKLWRQGVARFEKLAAADPQKDGYYRASQADTLKELALVLAAGGHVQEAETVYRQAIALREPLAKASPERRLAQANNYNDLAMILRSAKRLPAAEEASRQAVKLKQALVTEFPKKPEYRFHLAHSYLGLGYILDESGRTSDAVQATSEADRLLKGLASDASALAVLRDGLGHTLWQLSEAWTRLNRSEDAKQANQKALESFQQLAADHPENPLYRQEQGFSHRKLADLMDHDGQSEDAELQLRAALVCYQKLVAESPDSVFYRQDAAFVDCGLANLLLRTGRADDAEKTIRRSIETYELLVRDYPQNAEYRRRSAAAVRVLAELFARQNKLPKALVEWDKAAAEYTKAIELKPDDWESWSGRAFVHFHRQQWGQAVSDFSKAIELAPHVHMNWWHRGHSYLALAQWDKAAADFGKVVDQWPDGAEGWYLRGVAFAQLNQPDEALADLRQAIAKGFSKVEQMKTDPKLAPLRTREDFGKLLEEFEQQEKSKK